MKTQNYTKTKYACYYTNIANAAAFAFPPLLFVTFREIYSISYTLLGTLVLINFCTQLIVDLIFSFFSKYFNVRKSLLSMPLLITVGFLIYSLIPFLFPRQAYIGLIAGTVLFSIGAGLNEVLTTPVVAALPSNNVKQDISMLHSIYGWGVVIVIVISSVFFKLFTTENWVYLGLFFALLPLVSFFLLLSSPIPEVNINSATSKKKKSNKSALILCVICIFLGSNAENIMTNWISAYMEKVFSLPKQYGDILGMALFALVLAVTRVVYAKYGKSITNTLLISMSGAIACYAVAGLSSNSAVALIACVLTGVFTSMLWPGTLILMEELIPNAGVAAYALMASGGDLGASFGVQIMGVIADISGIQKGMLFSTIFPALGLVLLLYIKHFFKNKEA